MTPSHCSRYVQVQNGTVFCTCTYQEQREGVTRSFTVSCTYTTMNKEAVSQDLLLYPAPAYNMFMLITTVTSLAGCFFNCVLQECIYILTCKETNLIFHTKPCKTQLKKQPASDVTVVININIQTKDVVRARGIFLYFVFLDRRKYWDWWVQMIKLPDWSGRQLSGFGLISNWRQLEVELAPIPGSTGISTVRQENGLKKKHIYYIWFSCLYKEWLKLIDN